MALGKSIRGLNSFDLLGNLVPGVCALSVTLLVLPSPAFPTDIGEYALFAIVAFLFGGVVQSVASTFVGDRKHFDRTMGNAEARTNSELAEGPNHNTSTDTPNTKKQANRCPPADSLIWEILHPVFPFVYKVRPPRGKELDDSILVNRIWQYLIDTHEIPFRTTSYSVLYHVMSSRVDNIHTPSRAVRMQAIRNLNRGMWIASWYISVLLVLVILVDTYMQSGNLLLLIFEYKQPAIFDYWGPLWTLLPLTIVSTIFFWRQSESSEEDYIEYLFADYVVAVASEAEDISFDQATPLGIKTQLYREGDDKSSTESDISPPSTSEQSQTDE